VSDQGPWQALLRAEKQSSEEENQIRIEAETLLKNVREAAEARRRERLALETVDQQSRTEEEKRTVESAAARVLADYEKELQARPRDEENFRTFVWRHLRGDS